MDKAKKVILSLVYLVVFISSAKADETTVYKVFISAPDTLTYEGIRYCIYENGHVQVIGFANDSTGAHQTHSRNLYIPTNIVYNNKNYIVKSISEDAFSNCHHIQQVYISEGVEKIAYNAFYRCTSLTTLYIPSTVKSIDEAFKMCVELDTIIVSEKNETYDSRNNCNAIIESKSNRLIVAGKSTQIPNSVRIIGKAAFRSLYTLEQIDLHEGLEVIEGAAFMDCINLKSVNLPTSLREIHANAFTNTAIERSFIPKNVEKIGDAIYEGCNELKIIEVDKGNSKYTSPNHCNAIIEVASNEIIMGCKNTVIPHKAKSIGFYSFSGISSLTRIVIPKGINNISISAFRNCAGLTSIKVSKKNKVYDSRDNCNAIIRKENGDELIIGCKTTVIPSTIERISANAFDGRGTQPILVIPSNIKSIGSRAFYRCHNLRTVYLPEGIQHIGIEIFRGCHNLSTVYLPESLKQLPEYMFEGCINLSHINWRGSIELTEEQPFTEHPMVIWR